MIKNREVGEDGTPHLQGYVCFTIRLRLARVKKVFPRAHLEIKRGTVGEAIHYCKKPVPGCECEHCDKAREDGNLPNQWDEYGVVPIAGSIATKAKWESIAKYAKEGNFDALEAQYPSEFVRYYNTMKRIQQDHPEKPGDLREHDNYWIIAPTGYGKSRYVREKYPDYYDKAPNKWWIGYEGQGSVICDDYSPKECEHLGWYMKRWADLYSFPIETKGGGRQIRPTRIVVTSQYNIGECFTDFRVAEAMNRRFKVVDLDHWQTRLLRLQLEEIHNLKAAEVLDDSDSDSDTADTMETDSFELDLDLME